jgi:hypothetical protein
MLLCTAHGPGKTSFRIEMLFPNMYSDWGQTAPTTSILEQGKTTAFAHIIYDDMNSQKNEWISIQTDLIITTFQAPMPLQTPQW